MSQNIIRTKLKPIQKKIISTCHFGVIFKMSFVYHYISDDLDVRSRYRVPIIENQESPELDKYIIDCEKCKKMVSVIKYPDSDPLFYTILGLNKKKYKCRKCNIIISLSPIAD